MVFLPEYTVFWCSSINFVFLIHTSWYFPVYWHSYTSHTLLPMRHNFGFFLSNSFKQPLQRLIFRFLIISSYCCMCGSGCGGLGHNDFPKGTGFCFSTFTKFDNFESFDLLVSKGDGFFFEIFDSLSPFFRLRSFWLKIQ